MKFLSILVCILFFYSCVDIISDKEKTVVNKIFLFHTSGLNGYNLCFHTKKHFYDGLIDESILELEGTQDSIFVKSTAGSDTNYYLVRHRNGDTILSTKKISASQYILRTSKREFKYHFNAK